MSTSDVTSRVIVSPYVSPVHSLSAQVGEVCTQTYFRVLQKMIAYKIPKIYLNIKNSSWWHPGSTWIGIFLKTKVLYGLDA